MRGLEAISAALAVCIATIPARANVLAATPVPGEPEAITTPPFDPVEIVLPIFLLAAAISSLMALWRRGILKRRLDSAPLRDVNILEWPGWLAAGILIYLTPPIILAVVYSFLPARDETTDPLRDAAMQFPGYLAAIVAVIAMGLFLKGGMRKAGLYFTPRDLFTGLGAFLLIFPIVWVVQFLALTAARIISSLSDAAAPDQIAHTTLRQIVEADRNIWWWGTILAVTIGAPVVEEIVYRGFLQSAFVRVVGVSWRAIVITSLIFAAAHIGAVPPHALIGLFTLSICLGLLFERTGRLGPCIVAHALFNILNIIMAVMLTAPTQAAM